VELDRDKPGVVSQLNNLHQSPFLICSGNNKPLFLETCFILIIKLIAVPVALLYGYRAVCGICFATAHNGARVRAQPHGSAFVRNIFLIGKQIDNRVLCFWFKLGTVRILQPANVTRILNNRALHAKTDAKKRNIIFPRTPSNFNFTLNATVSKAAGYEDTCDTLTIIEKARSFNINILNLYIYSMKQAGMSKRFPDTFI